MAGDLNVSLILRAIDRSSAVLRKVTNNFEAIRMASKRASNAFQVSASIRQAGEAVSVFARHARALVTGPINEFENFEAAMSRVKALSGDISGEAFAQITAEAKRLGATTRFTAEQAAEGFGFFAMAGFNAADQMKALPTTMDLATAAGTDLGRTADVLSDIMGAFNKSSEEAVAVSDALAVTMSGSNTTLETLFETMKLVGPIATDLKIPLSDVAAMTGIMGSAGIKGSLAGTALRAMMQKLVAPTSAGAKALKKLGVQTKDANKNLLPMPKILADVLAATEEMGTAERGEVINKIFGVRALSGVSKLLGKLKGGELKKFSEEIKNSTGRAREMAKIMDDNAKGATVRLTSAISGLKTEMGDSISKALTPMKVLLTKIISGVTGWAKEHPFLTKAIGLTALAVAGLSTALAGLLFIVSTLVAAGGVMALAQAYNITAIAIFTKMIPAVLGLNAAMLVNPIFAIISGIMLLGIAAAFVWNKWDAISGWFIQTWNRFQNAGQAVKTTIMAILAPLALALLPITLVAIWAKIIVKNWKPVKAFFVGFFNLVKKVSNFLLNMKIPGWVKALGAPLIAPLLPFIGVSKVAAASAGTVKSGATIAAKIVADFGRTAAWIAGIGEGTAEQQRGASLFDRGRGGFNMENETTTNIRLGLIPGVEIISADSDEGSFNIDADVGVAFE